MYVPLTPLRCLERAQDIFGTQTGVVDGANRFTFGEFAGRAQRLAGALLAAGLTLGEPVAFLGRNSHQLLEAYFGIPLASGLVMPLNIRLAESELTWILRHSGARFLIYAEEFAALAETIKVPNTVQLGPEYENLLLHSTPCPIDIHSIDELSAASLFYTSGTTGTPRGVVHSHRALYLHALSVALTFHIDDTTVELYSIPLFHANGWGRPHAAMLMGAKQIVLPRFNPSELFRLVETERVTSLCLVPTMAEQLLAAPELVSCDLTSVREIHLGGSAVSASLVSRLTSRFRCRVTAGYGMTETGPVAITSGRPVVGSEMSVDDSGEILLAGDHLFTGYWGESPRHTRWLATGDLGRIDGSGSLSIVDRKKDIVISGGENISSLEVESALLQHPAVRECAIVAAPDPKWGEVPLAYVVLKQTATEEELSAWLRDRLASFKIPKVWRLVPGPLPRTSSGKIAKIKLRQIDTPPD